MSRFTTALAVACLLGLVAATPAARGATTLPSGFQDLPVESPVDGGTSLAFASDGRMFFNEGGRIYVRTPGSTTRQLVHNAPGFLLGMALDTDFDTNGYLYVLYVGGPAGAQNGRLARVVVGAGNRAVGTPKIILGAESCAAPSAARDCIALPRPENHAVGSVVSAPDGTLWVSNGDNASPGGVDPLAFAAQDPNSLAGKMLHIDREGRGLPGHRFCPHETDLTKNCAKVHALGLRNAYRFNLRPTDQLPIGGDVGWNTAEEINVYRAGGNYGWPCYEGARPTPQYSEDARCAALSAATVQPPIHEYSRTTGQSPIGGPIIDTPSWPASYQGDLIFGDYVSGVLSRLEFDADGDVTNVAPFGTGWHGGVELKLGPDGDLYYVTFGATGQVRKMRHVGGGNRAPTAVAEADTTPDSRTVRFSSVGSADPDGDALAYTWDFGDGAGSSQAHPVHEYAKMGAYQVRLEVRDPQGRSATASLRLLLGNADPTVTVTAPETFRAGDRIALRADAEDPEDGVLPASALRWTVLLHHDNHVHPLASAGADGVAAIAFTALDDHDADSHYIVRVTATDSAGATTVQTRDVRPSTTTLRLLSVPPGAPLSYAGSTFATPFSKPALIGFRTTVTAPERFTVGGKEHAFAGWSDGGARQHDVVIGSDPTELTATYEARDTPAPQPTPAPTPTATPTPPPGARPSRPAARLDLGRTPGRQPLGIVQRLGIKVALTTTVTGRVQVDALHRGRRIGSRLFRLTRHGGHALRVALTAKGRRRLASGREAVVVRVRHATGLGHRRTVKIPR